MEVPVVNDIAIRFSHLSKFDEGTANNSLQFNGGTENKILVFIFDGIEYYHF